MENDPTIIQPKILENLKKHKKHANNITCFECGYVGMMGVKKNEWSDSIAIFVSAATAFVLFLFLTIMIGIFWAGVIAVLNFFGFYSLMNRIKYVCPNCEKELRPVK